MNRGKADDSNRVVWKAPSATSLYVSLSGVSMLAGGERTATTCYNMLNYTATRHKTRQYNTSILIKQFQAVTEVTSISLEGPVSNISGTVSNAPVVFSSNITSPGHGWNLWPTPPVPMLPRLSLAQVCREFVTLCRMKTMKKDPSKTSYQIYCVLFSTR